MKNRIKATAASLILSLTLCTTLTGCTSAQVEAEVNAVLTQATNVLVVADPSAPWVPQLQKAIADLKTAEATWTSGGTVAVVIDALNTIELITADIPLTAQYSPLIDVLVAGIEACLALLPSTAATNMSAKMSRNPHIGRVVLKHHFTVSGNVKEFDNAWNSAANSNVALHGALIK